MKKLALSLTALGALVAFSAGASPASSENVTPTNEDGIQLACKPRGTSCHTGFECCSQSCQGATGKETCH